MNSSLTSVLDSSVETSCVSIHVRSLDIARGVTFLGTGEGGAKLEFGKGTNYTKYLKPVSDFFLKNDSQKYLVGGLIVE